MMGMVIMYWILYAVMLAGWVVGLIALWKLMRAHEDLAKTLAGIARTLRSQPSPTSPDTDRR